MSAMPEPGTPVLPAPKKLKMDDSEDKGEESSKPSDDQELKTFPTDAEMGTPNAKSEPQQQATSSTDGNKQEENEGMGERAPVTPTKSESERKEREDWAIVEEATIEGQEVPKAAEKHLHTSIPVEPKLFAMISKYMAKHVAEAKPLTKVPENIGDQATREMMAGTLLSKIQSLDPNEYEGIEPSEDDQLHARCLWVSTKEGNDLTMQWHKEQAEAKVSKEGVTAVTEPKEEIDQVTEINFEARVIRRA